jgi:opacity protein-like surface antigen
VAQVLAAEDAQTNNIQATATTAAPNNTADVSSVLGARRSEPTATHVALIPMVGGSDYKGAWGDHITHSYSLGLALEVPSSSNLAFEIEGAYNRFNTQYLQLSSFARPYSHDFNQYTIGGNAKLYIVRSQINPYIGAGAAALIYENMDHGNPFTKYNQTIGAGQLMAGADVNVSEQVAVGLRGTYLVPVLNRPDTASQGRNAMAGFEDASLMNESQYRVLGTVRMCF